MTREEFEVEYARRYMSSSFSHNECDAVDAVRQTRFEHTYDDEHIAKCWVDQQEEREW
jgi:hypothetical protein